MIKKLTFLIVLLASINSFADNGDTLVIQTIDHNTAVNPGWNAPRSGFYVFPSDTMRYSKILMYHTLQCDPTQNPPCGEWDYTTHNYLYEHTGIYDSNLYYHPNFIAAGSSPDSFMYMDDVSWKYRAWLEYDNTTTPTASAQVGDPTSVIPLNDPQLSMDGRHQYLFTAPELSASGLQEGDITGMQFSIASADGFLNKFMIRITATELVELTPENMIDEGFVTVFEKDKVHFSDGWVSFPFSFPFYWDGTSNLLVDISFDDDVNTSGIEIDADLSAFNSAISSLGSNNCLSFHEGDFIEVPVDGMATLDSAITISFWAYGNWMQPVNNSALEAFNEEGDRVLNIHLPWSNGNVYWDCGTTGDYDRIYKGTSADIYKGSWNHWAFTKDLNNGYMWIFLNGFPYHTGTGKVKPIDGIASFKIGSNGNGLSNYEGMLDEVRVFDVALDQETIAAWMRRSLDDSHPAFDNLIAYFQFNEGNGFNTSDASSYAVEGSMYGYPEWQNYHGKNRQMYFAQLMERPVVLFENGVYDPMALDSTVIVDTLPHNQIMIVMYEDFNNPTIPTDTLIKWPHYYDNFVFDAGANAIDSSLVTPDHILYKIESPYYVQYEVLKSYELGRYITPYGNNLSLGDGFTWVFDVTDFAHFLHDTVHLSAGNFQELLDLDFYMIEGIPPRDVVDIEKMWHGYWPLNNFEALAPPMTVHLNPEAEMFKLKVTTSGHEFDNATNCAEFCQKTHTVDVDSITRYSWEILDECADNALYPQGGTWIYDRAGWCPGARVTERNWEITPYIASDSVVLDYNCEYDDYGRYSVSSYFVSYTAPNFTMDAALDEIISPNNRKIYGRFNPMCGMPEIVIQNTGADSLYSLNIQYGPQSGIMQNYTWTGTLGFLDKEHVFLPAIDWTGWENGNNTFLVNIDSPNGGADEYEYNNSMNSNFQLTPEYPSEFVIKMRTNKVAYQNYYEILDAEGNVVYMRDDFENETTYQDTVSLANGCYTFILHDSGDNGISFWANNQGSGYITFKDLSNSTLYYFSPDFGKFTQKDFTVGLAVDIFEAVKDEFFELYPNPTSGMIHLATSLENNEDISIEVYDSRGTMILAEHMKAGNTDMSIDLSAYPAGMYFCTMKHAGGVSVKKVILTRY